MTYTAYVLISCVMGEEHTVLDKIKEISQIKTVLITFGDYGGKNSGKLATRDGRHNFITNKADSKNQKYHYLVRSLDLTSTKTPTPTIITPKIIIEIP